MGADNHWTVTLDVISNIGELRDAWTTLENRAPASFFQSWGWIGSWLDSLPKHTWPQVLTVRSHNRIVGLALLRRSRHRRHGFVRSAVLNLSETGDPRFDAATVEHNGILADAKCRSDVIQTALNWLSTEYGEWDELYARAMEASVAEIYRDAGNQAGLTTRMMDTCPYYYVDLDSVRARGADYLSQLSRNTRYQVRRAIKGYAKPGPVRVRIAETLAEAEAFFDRLVDLHQKYWTEKGKPGAFGDEFRQRFHSRLIKSRFAHGEIHLIEVSAPDHVIGFLYNFCYRGTVSNYQSGLSYSQDPKLKPGLVAHTMAIQNYLEGEQHTYDFLMGNHRYKRSLAGCEGSMGKLVLQRPRLRFLAEEILRQIRDRIRNA